MRYTVGMSKKAKRLFEQFQPEHYDIQLSFDKSAMTFGGIVTVRGKKVGRPSERITLHQRDLSFAHASITKHDKKGDQKFAVERINAQRKFDEVRLHSPSQLYPGQYTVRLEFSGKITDQMLGIYPCYFEYQGKPKFLVATQFESHYARNAFPCIDEPEAKATFQLTLTTPKHEVVLSNTLPDTEKVAGKNKVTVFKPTPRMSTYLLAFVFGDMHCVQAKTKSGTLVRSWSTVAQLKKVLDYSAQEAVKVLDFFTDYFGIAYPLEKCDQVALPDFDAGAMENWGLITYREIALLADPDNPSISSEQYISLVVAHELSHQWFGNLVTMQWWDDLWLNESFASIMEHLALDQLHPDWQQWEMFTSTDVIAAASRDIYSDVQPVGVEVTDPELIDTLFDPAIVYAKGARLLKMLRDYIGDTAFRQGLTSYFKALAYKNATRNDLWQHLSKASGKDISKLMTPWLTQPGMPLVHVSKQANQLRLRQERFVLDVPDDTSRWPIPLLADSKLSTDIMLEDSLNLTATSAFTRLNSDAAGHYLVHYRDKADQQKLRQAFGSTEISAQARIDVVNTLYLLARRGDSPLTTALDLVKTATDEPRDSVWSQILRVVGAAAQLTEGDKPSEKNLNLLKQRLASKQHAVLGWDDQPGDDPNTKQLRHTMLALMIGGEDKATVAEAVARYKKAAKPAKLPAEIRNTILGASVRFGDPSVVPDLLAAYPKASPDVQLDVTSALTSTRKSAEAKLIISKMLGPEGLARPQDIMRWLALFLRNHHVRDVAWQWMEDNWAWLEDTLGKSKSFDYLPTYCASIISTPPWQKKYQQFFEPKMNIKMLQRNIQVGLSDIAARVAWRQRDEAKIKAWLKAQAKNS